MLLGAIADDFTGATDLCSMLVRGGMRTVQLIGVPNSRPAGAGCRCGGCGTEVAHRAGAAGGQMTRLRRLKWLQRRRVRRQFFFKYCSTFDSTPQGNIGPVADALVDGAGMWVRPGLSGVPDQRAHRLPGPPVRRRQPV